MGNCFQLNHFLLVRLHESQLLLMHLSNVAVSNSLVDLTSDNLSPLSSPSASTILGCAFLIITVHSLVLEC